MLFILVSMVSTQTFGTHTKQPEWFRSFLDHFSAR
jgi:hypothetical protein